MSPKEPSAPETSATRARRLIRIQAISGLVFLSFLAIHLVNTMLATAGEGAYDGFQRTARLFYQFPIVETVVLAALGVHIVVGFLRIRERRAQKKPAHVPRRLFFHRLSGYFLVLVILGHILATRGPSTFSNVYPEFIGLNFSLASMPWFFFPYYVLLALSGLYHGIHGATVALTALSVRVPEPMRRGPIFTIAMSVLALLLVLGVLSIGGVLFPVTTDPTHPFAQLLTEVGASIGLTL